MNPESLGQNALLPECWWECKHFLWPREKWQDTSSGHSVTHCQATEAYRPAMWWRMFVQAPSQPWLHHKVSRFDFRSFPCNFSFSSPESLLQFDKYYQTSILNFRLHFRMLPVRDCAICSKNKSPRHVHLPCGRCDLNIEGIHRSHHLIRPAVTSFFHWYSSPRLWPCRKRWRWRSKHPTPYKKEIDGTRLGLGLNMLRNLWILNKITVSVHAEVHCN